MDQPSILVLVRKCFPELLRDPETRGMRGHAEVQNAATVMADDEEAVQHAKPQGRNREEIHGGQDFPVIFQKYLPSSRAFGIFRSFLHATRNGSFRDLESQLQQLAVDARCAPGGILGDHLKNEFAHFSGDWLSTSLVA